MTLQGFSSRSKQGLYRSLQGFGDSSPITEDFYPLGICINDNVVYVTELYSSKVMSFDTVGNFIAEFGGPGSTSGLFDNPEHIQTDGSYLYIKDNTRIIKHEFDGTYVDAVTLPFSSRPAALTYDGVYLCAYYGYGTMAGFRLLDSSLATVRDFNTNALGRSYFYDSNHLCATVSNPFNNGTGGFLAASNSGYITPTFVSTNSFYLGNFDEQDFGIFPYVKFVDGSKFYVWGNPGKVSYVDISIPSSDPVYTYFSTNVGTLDYSPFLANIYNNEIYVTSAIDKKIFVVDPSDASTIREWTR